MVSYVLECTSLFYLSSQISNPEFFQTSVNITLISLCNESELCSNCYDIEFVELLNQILQPVYELSFALGNGQCGEAVLQFFCNVIDVIDDDGQALFQQCLEVRDDKCAAEWRIAEIFFDVPLPSCDSFNGSSNFTFERAPVLSCPDDFGIFCGSLCQPLCARISLFNDAATVAYEVINIILHTISVVAGVITILVCCIQRKKMYANIASYNYVRCMVTV